MKNLILISIATIFLGMEPPAARASSAYTCEIFSYGSPTATTSATGINDEGQVIGEYREQGSTVVHAFVRNPDGSVNALTSPSGDDNFTPIAINNLGQILGPSFILNPDGTFITIDQPQAPPGHTYFPYQLSGLNDTGEVGGSFERDFNMSETGTIDFFIREPDGTFKIIDEIGTGSSPSGIPRGLNNADFMLQQIRYRDGYLIQPAGPKITLSYPGLALQSSGPEGNSRTFALNNKNVTSGLLTFTYTSFLRTPDGRYPSVVCPDAIASRLYVEALNDKNVVVGSTVQGGKYVGFIATPTGLTPQIRLSNRSWTFGPQVIGQLGGYGRIYVSNAGPADLHIQDIYIGNTGQLTDQTQSFRITAATCGGVPTISTPTTMAPGDWCYLDFSFTPQAPGWQTAAIYIPNESPRSPRIIRIGGTGIGSTLQLSNTSWDFGAHNVGDVTDNGVIYIYNQGPAVVTFRSTGTNGSPFEFHLNGNTCGGQLAAYTTCALSFNFTPMASGERTAIINLNDNSNYGPISIPIMGWVY